MCRRQTFQCRCFSHRPSEDDVRLPFRVVGDLECPRNGPSTTEEEDRLTSRMLRVRLNVHVYLVEPSISSPTGLDGSLPAIPQLDPLSKIGISLAAQVDDFGPTCTAGCRGHGFFSLVMSKIHGPDFNPNVQAGRSYTPDPHAVNPAGGARIEAFLAIVPNVAIRMYFGAPRDLEKSLGRTSKQGCQFLAFEANGWSSTVSTPSSTRGHSAEA